MFTMKQVKDFKPYMAVFRAPSRPAEERVQRRYTFKLYPNEEQEKSLMDLFGFHQRLYNMILSEHEGMWSWAVRKARKESGVVDFTADLKDQRKQLNKRAGEILRQEQKDSGNRLSWQSATTRSTEALRHLPGYHLTNRHSVDETFKRVYQGVEKCIKERMAGRKAFSRFHSFRSFPSVAFRRGSGWVFDGSHFAVVQGSKYIVSPIRVRGRFPGNVRVLDGVSIRRRKGGGWELSFAVDLLDNETVFRRDHEELRQDNVVGIDRGVTIPMITSDGDRFDMPPEIKRLESMIRRAYRTVARRKKGSNRWKVAKDRVAKLKARQARLRSHWQHEVSTEIARKNEVIILEDLNTQGMTRSAKGNAAEPGKNVKAKSGLNREILNVGWYALERHLVNKVEARGGSVEFIDPKNTSRRCAACGHTAKENRKTQASFECEACGHVANADLNAAINIRETALQTGAVNA